MGLHIGGQLRSRFLGIKKPCTCRVFLLEIQADVDGLHRVGETPYGNVIYTGFGHFNYVLFRDPPEASTMARPAINSTIFAISSGAILSSMMMSAPASKASATCAGVSASTSIFMVWNGCELYNSCFDVH